ncbi:unnamed protein product [Closterium sp. Naga37s-1]|nr:unnamed protein product [Closterium sp. Naga37s-1]
MASPISYVAAICRPADADASEAETAIFGPKSLPGSKPLIAVQAQLKTRTVDEDRRDGGGGQRSIRKVKGGEDGGGDERVERVVAGNAAGKSEGGGRKSYSTGGCKEEEEAVAVIAGVLREKFGPQIVSEEVEEWGSAEKVKEEEEEEEGWEGDDEEAEKEKYEEDAEAGTCEEDTPPDTSPPTHPPLLYNRRVVSPSSLLSLYRFFSSHLGISSPSAVASLLASHPQLLRSNPTNDFLPRVRLLQSYGIGHADIVHVTVRDAAWLRTSLARIHNTLDFLLAQGVRRSRLGSVLRRGRSLLRREAHSTNLDILVGKAGVPVDKLGVIIEGFPSILTWGKEAVNIQLERLSRFFKVGSGGKVEADSTSSSLLKHQLEEPQSLISPDAPSVLWRAPAIVFLSSENLLAKLQFFVELVGEEATGRVARSHPWVLELSKENLQRKVAALVELIGRENAVRVVGQFPSLLSSSEDVMKETFSELVREVKEVLEGSGEEGSGIQRLEEGERGNCLEGENESRAFNSAGGDKRCRAHLLVVDLVVKYPFPIRCSWKKNLKHKVEYLKRDMGLSIKEVLAYRQFLGFNLDRRIRPRHVALVRMGYAVVAHEMVSRMSVGERRDFSLEAGEQRSKLVSVSSPSDEMEGVEGLEWGAENRKCERTGDSNEQQGGGEEDGGREVPLEELLGTHEPGGRDGTEQQLVKLEGTTRAVCLRQFLHCSDKQFEEKFGVKL